MMPVDEAAPHRANGANGAAARASGLRVVDANGEDVSPRPVVRLGPDVDRVADDAIEILTNEPNLYVRDGALVRVVRDPKDLTAAPRVTLATLPNLIDSCSRHADWVRYDKRAKQWFATQPPKDVVAIVSARGEWPELRPLVAVLEAPAFRPDGSIIQTPGYDAATACLFDPTCTFPAVPDAPTQADAARALAELGEPFEDMPFASEPDRAAALATVITLLARPMIAGSVPATVYSANVAGAGKTLAADTASSITTGRPASKMNYPDDEAELEKCLAAYAVQGTPLILFDNVVRPFGGGPLDRCLTAVDKVDLRILGRTEVPTLRWRAVITATGNNMVITGDTARRVLFVRLESPLENPEDRVDVKHRPLIPWVLANRARFVVAALTIVRAWVAAGRPRMTSRAWGSFEAWTDVVPQALMFAGAADPMSTRAADAGAPDVQKDALVALLEGWDRLAGARGLSAKDALSALYPPRHPNEPAPDDGFSALREAIEILAPPKAGKVSSVQLAKALRQANHRVIAGRMLDGTQNAHTKTFVYRVVPAREVCGGCG